MTDLDQNALDAACKAFAAGRYGSAQATASERDQVTGAITAYLAKRREQGYVLIDNPSVAVYDAVMERAEADTARSIAEIVTAAIEEEREACASLVEEAP